MSARFSKTDRTTIETAASAWIIRRDAGLSAEEAVAFEHWRSADPRHAAAFAAHDQAWSLLDRPRQAGEAEFMRREYHARQCRRQRRRVLAGTCAAAVALVVLLSWQFRPADAGQASVNSPTTVIVTPQERLLPDGSHVELRSGAQIKVAFEPGVRRVHLDTGEAHFEVMKDPARPFIVSVAGIEVRAVGTAFSVQLGAKTIAVIVTEGRVGIERSSPTPAEPAAMLLDAGKRALLPVERSAAEPPVVTSISVSEIDEQLAWRKTHLEFADTPLSEAVALMNRHSAAYGQTRLALGDATVAAVRVSGYFRADSVDAFVRLIAASAGIEASEDGGTTTLRVRR